MKENSGFTLVELLAVILILAIIMIIAIPSVLNTLNMAKKKSFLEYVDKIASETQKASMANALMGGGSDKCVIYNIKTDLGLASTGNYEGYSMISDDGNVYVTLTDGDYYLNSFQIGSGDIDSKVTTSDVLSRVSPSKVCDISSCESCYTKKKDAEDSGASYTPVGESDSDDSKVSIKPRGIAKNVKYKDYISYVPNSTSYTLSKELTGFGSDQVINPSKIKLWRVLRVNSDNSVTIIGNTASEKVSIYGLKGYLNYEYVVNRASEAYINGSYVSKAVSFGYANGIEQITDLHEINNLSRPCNGSNNQMKYGCGDFYNASSKDYELYKEMFGPEGNYNVRVVFYARNGYRNASVGYGYWTTNTVDNGWAINGTSPLRLQSGELVEYTIEAKILPVLTLYGNVLISGGNGTKASPYTLTVE